MAAVRLMCLGALLAVAFIPVFLMDMDLMREAMYVDVDPNDPAFGPGYDAFVDGFVITFAVLTAFVYAASAAAWLWMAAMTNRGRSWARITASILGGVNLLACASTFASGIAAQVAPDLLGPSPGTGAPMMILTAVYAGVSVVALVLLWRRPVSDYVQAVSDARRWEQWRSRQGRTAGTGHPGQ